VVVSGRQSWNVRRGTGLSSSGSGSKGCVESSRVQEGLRRDGTYLGTLPVSALPPSA